MKLSNKNIFRYYLLKQDQNIICHISPLPKWISSPNITGYTVSTTFLNQLSRIQNCKKNKSIKAMIQPSNILLYILHLHHCLFFLLRKKKEKAFYVQPNQPTNKKKRIFFKCASQNGVYPQQWDIQCF